MVQGGSRGQGQWNVEVETPRFLAGAQGAFQGHSSVLCPLPWSAPGYPRGGSVPTQSSLSPLHRPRRPPGSRLGIGFWPAECLDGPWLARPHSLPLPVSSLGPSLLPTPPGHLARAGARTIKAPCPQLACGIKNELRSARLSFPPDETSLSSIPLTRYHHLSCFSVSHNGSFVLIQVCPACLPARPCSLTGPPGAFPWPCPGGRGPSSGRMGKGGGGGAAGNRPLGTPLILPQSPLAMALQSLPAQPHLPTFPGLLVAPLRSPIVLQPRPLPLRLTRGP